MADWRKIEAALVKALEVVGDYEPFRPTDPDDTGDWVIQWQINEGAEGDMILSRLNLTAVAKRMAEML